MKPIKKKLPSKLSALIRVALRDLAKAEKSNKYRVSMYDWHYKPARGKCRVCLAGSVMAFSLGSSPLGDLTPSDFDDEGLGNKLRALNAVRSGYVNLALSKLGEDERLPKLIYPVPDYNISKLKFKNSLRAIAKMLDEKGL